MKVILTQEVKGRGHEGDVIDVARGFAVNYLLPRKMAIEATPGNLKQLESRMTNIEKRNAERRTDAEGVAAALEGKTIVIEAKAGDEGKLFGSVTTLMIEEAIADQLGPDVDHRRMDLSKPIKELGDYDVSLSVYGDVKATLHVSVIPEGGAAGVPATLPETPVVEVATEPAADEATDAEQAEAEITEVEQDAVAEETGEE